MTTLEQDDDAARFSWDRAFEEIERSRQENRPPDTSRFEELTKAVG